MSRVLLGVIDEPTGRRAQREHRGCTRPRSCGSFRLGKSLYFPKGILTQTAEAKQKATRYNATIGEARERAAFHGAGPRSRAISANSSLTRCCRTLPHPAGRICARPGRSEIREKNPSLGDIPISLPVVTSGITHGLSTIADMFVDPGDVVPHARQAVGQLLARLRRQAGGRVVRYPLLDLAAASMWKASADGGEENAGAGKIVVLFNFPNNPTGYSITPCGGRRHQGRPGLGRGGGLRCGGHL